jgi:L-alanine-DL-glutamate epimerase-like enolase superfamily enzyme
VIVSWKGFVLHPRVPFTIARGTTTQYERVHVQMTEESEQPEGWGEAAPSAYYQESAQTVHEALLRLFSPKLRAMTIDSLEDIEALEAHMRETIPDAAAARAAVSIAAHDLLGKKLGRPLFEVFGLDPNLAPPSSFTIAITESESELARRVEEAHEYPILKVKLGTDHDEFIVRAVRRAAPQKLLRVDANAAWTVERTIEMSAFLADQGVELIEQPLPRDDIDGYWRLRDRVTLPIIADESCIDSRDLPRLDGAVDGINIKLAKCGGLAEARRMAIEARNRGMKVMLGCMIESSVGISAAAHLAPLADYADLDGAALLADDPFVGASISGGVIRLTDAPGLGVQIRRT